MKENLHGFEESNIEKLKNEAEEERKALDQIRELENDAEKKLDRLETKIEEIEHQEHHHHEHKLLIKVVVNTIPTEVRINEKDLVRQLAEIALEQTGTEGRPIGDWRIKWNDVVLDMNREIKSYHFPEGTTLFMSLKAGEGGNNGK